MTGDKEEEEKLTATAAATLEMRMNETGANYKSVDVGGGNVFESLNNNYLLRVSPLFPSFTSSPTMFSFC